MALTIVEKPVITGGVDTHADVHVAAALNPIGGLLGTESFATTPAGYGQLWLGYEPLGRSAWLGSRAPGATVPGSPGT